MERYTKHLMNWHAHYVSVNIQNQNW
jgi:hypothetical protein